MKPLCSPKFLPKQKTNVCLSCRPQHDLTYSTLTRGWPRTITESSWKVSRPANTLTHRTLDVAPGYPRGRFEVVPSLAAAAAAARPSRGYRRSLAFRPSPFPFLGQGEGSLFAPRRRTFLLPSRRCCHRCWRRCREPEPALAPPTPTPTPLLLLLVFLLPFAVFLFLVRPGVGYP